MENKREYWKVVSPEWPQGVICDSREEARHWAEAEREEFGPKEVYTRRVRLSEAYVNNLPETD